VRPVPAGRASAGAATARRAEHACHRGESVRAGAGGRAVPGGSALRAQLGRHRYRRRAAARGPLERRLRSHHRWHLRQHMGRRLRDPPVLGRAVSSAPGARHTAVSGRRARSPSARLHPDAADDVLLPGPGVLRTERLRGRGDHRRPSPTIPAATGTSCCASGSKPVLPTDLPRELRRTRALLSRSRPSRPRRRGPHGRRPRRRVGPRCNRPPPGPGGRSRPRSEFRAGRRRD